MQCYENVSEHLADAGIQIILHGSKVQISSELLISSCGSFLLVKQCCCYSCSQYFVCSYWDYSFPRGRKFCLYGATLDMQIHIGCFRMKCLLVKIISHSLRICNLVLDILLVDCIQILILLWLYLYHLDLSQFITFFMTLGFNKIYFLPIKKNPSVVGKSFITVLIYLL